MEEVILAHKFESLWENEEAKYYKFPDKPYALKVSRIAGALELLSFIIQTSNTRKAGHLVDAATLKISSKEEKYISYLLVDFPGKMEKQMQVDLEPDEKAKFQQDAIERYRTHYNMINMYVLTFPAGGICLLSRVTQAHFRQLFCLRHDEEDGVHIRLVDSTARRSPQGHSDRNLPYVLS